jgi:hypothetical protein
MLAIMLHGDGLHALKAVAQCGMISLEMLETGGGIKAEPQQRAVRPNRSRRA